MGDYALLLNADTDQIGQTANAFEYAINLDDHGHDVDLYFDGVATTWPGELAAHPNHPVNAYFAEAAERGLIGGACEYCANAFGGLEGVESQKIPLLGDGGHAPDVGAFADEGRDLITVG